MITDDTYYRIVYSVLLTAPFCVFACFYQWYWKPIDVPVSIFSYGAGEPTVRIKVTDIYRKGEPRWIQRSS